MLKRFSIENMHHSSYNARADYSLQFNLVMTSTRTSMEWVGAIFYLMLFMDKMSLLCLWLHVYYVKHLYELIHYFCIVEILHHIPN